MTRYTTTLMSLAIAVAIPSGTLAADLAPVEAAPIEAVAPSPRSWTGIYAGGTFGAGHSSVDFAEDFGFDILDAGRFGDNSFTAGGFIGVQAQVSRFVFGLEGDATWLNNTYAIRLSEVPFDAPDVGPYPDTDTEWMYSVSGRAGYLLSPDTLLYGRAGWAWIDVESPAYGGYVDGSETIDAWQAGVGMETRISDFVIWRTELLYTQANDSYDFVDDFFGDVFAESDFSYLTARFGLGLQLGIGTVERAAQPEDFDWSGFYAGIFGGGAGTDTPLVDYELRDRGPYSELTGIYGGRIGANIEMGDRWVAGVEAEVTKIGAEYEFEPEDNFGFEIETSAAFDWMASAGVRLGWLATPGTLIYAKGAAAWVQSEAYEPFFTEDTDGWVRAYQVGGGIETKLSDHLSVRMEALYTSPDEDLDIDQFDIEDSEAIEPSIVSGTLGLTFTF